MVADRAVASWAAAGRLVVNAIAASPAASVKLFFIYASTAAVAAFKGQERAARTFVGYRCYATTSCFSMLSGDVAARAAALPGMGPPPLSPD